MKRRILVIALVTTGSVVLIPSTAVALSGPSDSGSAARVVYPTTTTTTTTPTTTPTPTGQVLGDTPPETVPETVPGTSPAVPPEVLPETAQSAAEPAQAEGVVAESRPVVVGAEEGERVLPFTGFLAIPVLMLAAAMLLAGLALRRHGGSRAPASA